MSIGLSAPNLNGVVLTHEELRAIHENMRIAVHAATAERALDGPRLLDPRRGERYSLKAVRRDREGNLLAQVTIYLPWSGAPYVRRFRLIKKQRLNLTLSARVDKVLEHPHT